MKKILLKHQKKGLKVALRTKTLGLFWEMRLGKTLLTIRWLLRKVSKRGKILVAAPLSVLESWEEELDDEGIRYCVLTGSKPQRRKAYETAEEEGTTWYLINYEGLIERGGKRAKPSFFAGLHWDAVVLDESTRVRKSQAKVTKVVCKFLARAEVKAILSGLPAPESSMDYFEQMRFLFLEFLGSKNFWDFRLRNYLQCGFEWLPKGKTLARIKESVRSLCMVLTRKQAGLGCVKVKEIRRVDLPPVSRRIYKKAEDEYELAERECKHAVVSRIWCSQIAGGCLEEAESKHKLNELLNLLEGELKEEPVIVYFRFNAELRAAGAMLKKAGITCTRIHGGVGRKLRSRRRRAAAKGKYRVILCQTKCVRYGLDFSFSSTVIYFSNWEDYEMRAQSEDRIEHPKKKEPLLYIDLLVRDSVEEDIHDALQGKGACARYFQSNVVKNLKRRRERKK